MQTFIFTGILSFVLLFPIITNAHSGGIDERGGHHCWTNCVEHGYFDGQYHFHPEKMNTNQLRQYENFKGRLCERVVRRFSKDEKMWQRVNERVQKRFGFACER